ncbi:MAG: DegV family protein [Acholeplasmataceae bacterium]
MRKVAIVVTSTSGIDYLKEAKDVTVARLTVSFDGKEYIDYSEMKAEAFYDKMLEKPDAPIHTSQVSTGMFTEIYEKIKEDGFDELLVVTISSKLSGTYQGAILAKDMVDGIKIEVVDSKSVSLGEGLLVLKALDMVKEGKTLDDIVPELEKFRDKIEIYVLVDTLKYLVKNGRLSSAAGLLGTLLRIKPLLKIMPDGSLQPYEKIRTTTKAQKRILELVLSETKDRDPEFFIAYTTNKDKALEFEKELKAANPKAKITLIPLTPVVGAHAGPGTLGIGFYNKKEK